MKRRKNLNKYGVGNNDKADQKTASINGVNKNKHKVTQALMFPAFVNMMNEGYMQNAIDENKEKN